MSIRLLPDDLNQQSLFGFDVALDARGKTALIAAPQIDVAYLFRKRDNETWSKTAKLQGEEGVALSDDGQVAAATPFIYEFEGTSWTRAAKPGSDGNESVSLASSGTVALIGDPGTDTAKVYTKTEGTWSKTVTLFPGGAATSAPDPNSAAGAHSSFGHDVALDASGRTAVVGDYTVRDPEGRGAVHVFTSQGEGWSHVVKLKPDDLESDEKIRFANLGRAVAIDGAGETIFGAVDETPWHRTSGATYVFKLDGGTWTTAQKISDPDFSIFGSDVALSKDGQTALVGDHGASTNIRNGGLVHVYKFDGTKYSHQKQLSPFEPHIDEQLGFSVAIAETTALAGAWGYETEIEDVGAAYVFDLKSTFPSVGLADFRPIQVIEDTVLRSADGETESVLPTPPDFVAKRPTSVLFNLHGSVRLGSLPSDATVEIRVRRMYSDGSSKVDSFRLAKDELMSLAATDTDEREYFNQRSLRDRIPVFNPSEDLQRITLEVPPDIDGDGSPEIRGASKRASFGPDDGYNISSMKGLTVGFIEIADPGEGNNYGASDGGLEADFDTLVNRATERIAQTYPTHQVTVRSHPRPLQGTATESSLGYSADDLQRARTALENEFPESDFQVTVAVVPGDYTDFHGDECLFGLHPCGEENAALVRGSYPDGFPEENFEATVVHEIGHHFLPLHLYPKKLALRLSLDGEMVTQRSHARTESNPNGIGLQQCDESDAEVRDSKRLDSTGFDLTDGSYRLVDTRLRSFMSYDFNDFPQWPDSHAYQRMIDEDLESHPFTEYACNTYGRGSGPIIKGIGKLRSDGSVKFTTFIQGEGAPFRSMPAGEVTIRVVDPLGSVLDERSFSHRLLASARSLNPSRWSVVKGDVFSFAVPFPEEAATIEVKRDGAITRVNPIGRVVRNGIRRIPDPAFQGGGTTHRKTLAKNLDAVEELMSERDYQSAAQDLREMRETMKGSLHDDYDIGALQPTKQELLKVLDGMVHRLERLQQLCYGGGQDDRETGESGTEP